MISFTPKKPASPMGRNRMSSMAPTQDAATGAGNGNATGRLARAGMSPSAPSVKKPAGKKK